MQQTLSYLFTAVLTAFLMACGSRVSNEAHSTEQAIHAGHSLPRDTTRLKETLNQDDVIINEYLAGRLKPIRENFKRINSITTWDSINNRELAESTEGGEAKYYYRQGKLEKIVTRHFGETFQKLTEYYLLNGQLSFVFEKVHKYNRPMYYDSAAMKENADSEAFDFEKSFIIEGRSYFDKGEMIHQVNNQDGGSPFAVDYLIEQQNRLLTDFRLLMKDSK